MFKFCFSTDACEKTINDEDECNLKWNDCIELIPKRNEVIDKILANAKFSSINVDGVQIKYIHSKEVVEILRSNEKSSEVSVLKAEENHSDLLPAVYEGGFKIWECTYDILKYLGDNKLSFQNKNVLDLGCGNGIVGIYTLLCDSHCCFQDYNSDVLEYITMSNVSVNSKDCVSRCKFYCGDWQSFSNTVGNNITEDCKYDFIFTSETIYNIENYYKLHKVFETLLKKDGTIFLAAKSFYFGVGGGVSLFQEYLDKFKVFKYSCCWKCIEGVKREILKIQFIDVKYGT